MTAIGNIGAVPVYLSEQDVPASLRRQPGLRVAVWRGGSAVEFFEVSAPQLATRARGLGIALAAGAAAGSTVGPIGTLIGVGVSVVASLFGRLFGGGGPSPQERQAGAAFEELAGRVTQFFNQIQAQPVITQNDVALAEQALGQLAQFAQQYGAVEYVRQKWNDPNYRPAYEQRLGQIRQAAAQATAATPPASSPGAGAGAATLAGDTLNLILPVALIAVIVLLRR